MSQNGYEFRSASSHHSSLRTRQAQPCFRVRIHCHVDVRSVSWSREHASDPQAFQEARRVTYVFPEGRCLHCTRVDVPREATEQKRLTLGKESTTFTVDIRTTCSVAPLPAENLGGNQTMRALESWRHTYRRHLLAKVSVTKATPKANHPRHEGLRGAPFLVRSSLTQSCIAGCRCAKLKRRATSRATRSAHHCQMTAESANNRNVLRLIPPCPSPSAKTPTPVRATCAPTGRRHATPTRRLSS